VVPVRQKRVSRCMLSHRHGRFQKKDVLNRYPKRGSTYPDRKTGQGWKENLLMAGDCDNPTCALGMREPASCSLILTCYILGGLSFLLGGLDWFRRRINARRNNLGDGCPAREKGGGGTPVLDDGPWGSAVRCALG